MTANRKTMTVKVRGEHGAGKSELLELLARLAGDVGMQVSVDRDHKLTIVSTGDQRCRLWALNRRCICKGSKGVDGRDKTGHDEARAQAAAAEQEVLRLTAILNTPDLDEFASAAVKEARHQVYRWGQDHDAGKTAWDWFWTLGYLGGKAAAAALAGNLDKALHHTITAAALLANWHRQLLAARAAAEVRGQ